MVGSQLLKRIPRIKFPNRRAGEHLSHQLPSQAPTIESKAMETSSKAVPSPKNLGGRASEQPKRTPVSEKEIEAILKMPELHRLLADASKQLKQTPVSEKEIEAILEIYFKIVSDFEMNEYFDYHSVDS